MPANITEAVAGLASRVTDALEQLVTTRVQFEELRRSTKETIDEYKHRLERAEDKIDRIERERIAREAELIVKIDGLNARLNAISEQALHAAVERTLRGLAQEGQIKGALKSLPSSSE